MNKILSILKKIGKAILSFLDVWLNIRRYASPHYVEYRRWLSEMQEKYEGLPRGCWDCELLGMCRRPKEQNWKCYDGCMLINQKYDGLPRRCQRCELLETCRRPKEQGWKCYNGCIIINQQKKGNVDNAQTDGALRSRSRRPR